MQLWDYFVNAIPVGTACEYSNQNVKNAEKNHIFSSNLILHNMQSRHAPARGATTAGIWDI